MLRYQSVGRHSAENGPSKASSATMDAAEQRSRTEGKRMRSDVGEGKEKKGMSMKSCSIQGEVTKETIRRGKRKDVNRGIKAQGAQGYGQAPMSTA